MVTLAEIESLACKLPESQRAKLAADLLDSLPGVLVDDDEGLAEALCRSEEMDRDPGVCLSHDEFLKVLENRNESDPPWGIKVTVVRHHRRSPQYGMRRQ